MANKIREIKITGLPELIQAVTPETPDPESGRLRSYTVYRGVNDAGHHPLTSLDRLYFQISGGFGGNAPLLCSIRPERKSIRIARAG